MIQSIQIVFADQNGTNLEINNTPLPLTPKAGGKANPEVRREGKLTPQSHSKTEEDRP